MEEEECLIAPKKKEPLLLRRRRLREYEEEELVPTKRRREKKGALLASHKPSYCLRQGIGTSQFLVSGESLRSQHRKRLWGLLQKLMHHHNWAEATGVLAVLIQGTVKDPLPSRNRAKYSAALELLNQIKGESISSRRVQSVYELWMKKMGPLKYWSTKNRFAVQLECIVSCLQRGSTEDAHQAALCLMQEYGFDSDPVSNLVVGLTFYQLWYTSIPKELQLTELNSSGTYMQPEIPIEGICESYNNSKENDAPEGEADSRVKGDSNTSVANDKEAFDDVDSLQREVKDNDVDTRIETPHSNVQPQEPYMHSAGESAHTDDSFSNYSGDLPHASIFYTQGLPPWLLPIKLPDSHENLEDALSMHRKLQNDHYKSALKHLRVALYSTPPALEAFHPLIQMLLLGDRVREALGEFENILDSSDTILQLRLKASLLEHFESGNHVKLYTCFEDTLKKDPTCSDSLGRLILMHHRGDYKTQNLAEMIALHLDATYGTHDTWKELASCFFKLSQCEEDRVSACRNGNDRHSVEYLDNANKIPELFTNSDSTNSWKFRCRWWLNRHFHINMLMSDIASGDLELLTYKASAASHLYGQHFQYVVKATECLEKENNMGLYSLLQLHILNSIGFYSVKRNTL